MPKKITKKIKRQDTYPSFLITLLSILVILLIMMVSYFAKPAGQTVNNKATESGINPLTQNTQTSALTQPKTQAGATVTQGAGAVLASTRVKYKIDHFKKLDRQPLEFQVFDAKNKLITPNDLKVVNQAKLQLVVISSNLKEFQSLRPAFQNGKWLTAANMPTAGSYNAYVIYTPVTGHEEILRSELVAQKASTGAPYPGLTTELKTAIGEYFAQLSVQKPVIFQQTQLTFNLTNKNGTPATNLMSLFGEFGHLVIVREGDPDTLINLGSASSDTKKGLVQFVTSFAKEGRYVAFAQFKLGLKTLVFPIVFEIKNS